MLLQIAKACSQYPCAPQACAADENEITSGSSCCFCILPMHGAYFSYSIDSVVPISTLPQTLMPCSLLANTDREFCQESVAQAAIVAV